MICRSCHSSPVFTVQITVSYIIKKYEIILENIGELFQTLLRFQGKNKGSKQEPTALDGASVLQNLDSVRTVG